MATLASVISKSISQNLLNSLPAALAEEFGIEAEAVKAFLNTYLAAQLPSGKGKAAAVRSPTPKGTNGKGRTSGFMMFTAAHREQVIAEAEANGEVFYKQKKTEAKNEAGKAIYEDAVDEDGAKIPLAKMPVTEVTKRVGAMWRGLSDAEREQWNAKAVETNTANGLPPAAKQGAAKPVVAAKPAAAKQTAAETTGCQFVITRGPNKGNHCTTKPKGGETFCSKHKSSASASQSDE